VATGLGCGLAPIAPGTVGSLVALIIYYYLPIAGDSVLLYALVGVGFLVGVAATGTLSHRSDPDPRRVVWDEFVGMWAACLLLPKSPPWLAAAFLGFRALDIWKPWPIRRLEQLPGGLGIMADDLLAGLCVAAVLNAVRLALFS
jgi:phosphatidylglycerophosphatase A